MAIIFGLLFELIIILLLLLMLSYIYERREKTPHANTVWGALISLVWCFIPLIILFLTMGGSDPQDISQLSGIIYILIFHLPIYITGAVIVNIIAAKSKEQK